jgi:hypothetical protein
MRIEEHPFYVLGITPRSNKIEILDPARASDIQADHEKVAACTFQVMHPAKRLDAEVSWFPGVAPSRVRKVIDAIREDPDPPRGLRGELAALGFLAKFNALAYWLSARDGVRAETWEIGLHDLAQYLQSVDAEDVTESLNAERLAAGWPQITDAQNTDNAVKQLGEATAEFLARRLTSCPDYARVLTAVVERDQDNGSLQASAFISRFVERYQIQVQASLERRAERVDGLCARTLSLAQNPITQAATNKSIRELEVAISAWVSIARPVQLLMKSRGLKHTPSIDIAKRVHGTAVTLANDHGLHDQSLRIVRHLTAAFESVPEVTAVLEKDLRTLEDLAARAEERRALEEKQQTLFNLNEYKRHCNACGLPMVPGTGHHAGEYECVNAECRSKRAPTAFPMPSPSTAATTDPEEPASIGAFVELCRSIKRRSWEQIKNNAYQDENIRIFNAARTDYRRQAAPWLCIISATHGYNAPPTMEARNAAAECLSSLAGGFLCMNDFETAQSLSAEALPLVFEDDKLKAEINFRLTYIASKRQEASHSSSRPSPRANPQRPTRPAASNEPANPANRVGMAREFFSGLGSPTLRTSVIALVASALVLAVIIGFQIVSAPPFKPSLQSLTRGSTGWEEVAPQASVFNEPLVPYPPTGRMEARRVPASKSDLAPLKVIAPVGEQNYYVKFYDVRTGDPTLTLFVRSGETASAEVPLGTYKVHIACGESWYGDAFRFGPGTLYGEGDQLTFSREGDVQRGHKITLGKRVDGNYNETPIKPTEF